MTRIKYAVDPPFLDVWANRVGRLVLNFAAVESQTFLWLAQLTERPDEIPQFATQPFARRCDRIEPLIENRAFAGEWKESALSLWAEARRLAHMRNRVAHNPLLFAWSDDSEVGAPDLIGVPDFRSGARGGPSGLMTTAKIDAATNELAVLVPRLDSTLREWCAIRDRQ
jgi:hypothetical protein